MQVGFKRLRCLVCMTLAFAVIIAPSAIKSSAAGEPAGVSAGYEMVANNASMAMYADMETGLFDIVDKNSGYVWSSTSKSLSDDKITKKKDKIAYSSQLIIDYITNEGFISSGISYSTNSQIACINSGGITVEKIDNGIRVEYNFVDYKIIIPVNYTISAGEFKASIEASNIKEGKDYALRRVQLLPSFGAGDWKDSGYIFVPDGTGALINFNNGADKNRYDAQVYGTEISRITETKYSQNEIIRMPVFGLTKGNTGFVAIISNGDASASIAAVTGNSSCGVNMAFSIMEYRTIAQDQMISQSWVKNLIYKVSSQKFSAKTYDVVYKLHTGSNFDYVNMATEYRNFLIKEKGLKKKDGGNLINLDVYGAVEVQANFLGFKYKRLETLTTFDEAQEILRSLQKDKVSDISLRYIGWQNDGPFNIKQLKKSKILGRLGGKSDFRDLAEFISDKDGELWCDTDLVQARKASLTAASATPFNKLAYQYQYLRSVYVTKLTVDPWLVLNAKTLKSNADSYIKSLDKSIKNVSLSTVTNLIYSDFHRGSGTFRTGMADAMTAVLKKFDKAGYNIAGDSANAYTIPYLSKIYKAPTLTSGYMMFNKEVPFYQIVLHGYIPMTGAAQQTEITTDTEFLKAVETGSGILYNATYEDASIIRGLREEDIYSSSFDLWKDRAKTQYKSYSKLFEQIKNEPIVSHTELSKNVMKTVFKNGVSVIVNYNYDSVKIDETKIDARSFSVGKREV